MCCSWRLPGWGVLEYSKAIVLLMLKEQSESL